MLRQAAAIPSPTPTRRQFLGALGAGLTLGALACKPEVSSPQSPAAGPEFDVLAGRPTANSVTLNVLPSAKVPWFVEWGKDPNALDHRSEIQPESLAPVELVLDGLSPSARYYYRVKSAPADAVAPNRAFHTQRPVGESFVFTLTTDAHLIPGNPRKESSPFHQTMSLVHREAPDFHITLGDETMTHGPAYNARSQSEADAAYVNWRLHYADIARAAPVFFALGNHEGEGWIGEGFGFSRAMATQCRQARLSYVASPNRETYPQGGGPEGNYFSWNWGDALFVVLDPYTYSPTKPSSPEDWTLGPDQLSWLEGVLKSSTQKWKLLFQHQLIGGSTYAQHYGKWGPYANYGRGGATLAHIGEQAAIHQLMLRYDGTIIFKGHDHVYVDETRDGLHYITCGRLSRPRQPGWARRDDFQALYPGGFEVAKGYLRVAVAPAALEVKYIDYAGQTLHSTTVLA